MWRRLEQLYQSNVINALIVIIGAILTFLPMYIGEPSNLEDTTISDASDSELFRNASVALLSLVSPLIVDSIFDLLNAWLFVDNRLSKTNAKSTIDDCSFDWKEKVLFILGIIILPINIFLPRSTRNLTLILICARKCRLVLCTGAVGCSLCRREHIISKPLITACLLLYNISAATGSFAQNTQGIIPPGPKGFALFYVNIIFSYMPVIVALAFCVWWLLRIALVEISKRMQAVSNTAIMEKIKLSLGDSCTGNYLAYRVGFILILLLWGILSATLTVRYKNISSFDELGMFLDLLPYILFVLAQTALSMRLVKFEAVQGLYALLDSKKQYVRYISHEIRTPLNAAFLGLKILIDDLKKSTNPRDVDRYETLCDVNLSCTTAIDILNDLLSFEKLESGILTLNMETVHALSFVEECVSLFSAQAKSHDIKLVLNPHMNDANDGEDGLIAIPVTHSDSDYGKALPLLPSDEIQVDKFKMAQVVRNLISNALKFSPGGSTVSVVTYFVPGAPQLHNISSKSNDSNAGPLTPLSPMSRMQSGRHLSSIDLEAGGGRSAHGGSTRVFNNDDNVIDGKLRIVVTDSGAGISPENQKKLFKEVVQFNPEKLQAGGGSGFGLFISKSIVDLHKGTVSVYSAGEGHGSSFTIEIPMTRSYRSEPDSVNLRALNSVKLSKVAPTDYSNGLGTFDSGDAGDFNGIADHSKTHVGGAGSFKYVERVADKQGSEPSYKILVVDDSKLNRKMLCKILIEAGHKCYEADDGLKAVQSAKESQKVAIEYDAILMDFMMPNLDGPSATKQIRDMGYKAPIFGVTGNGLQSDIDHFKAQGANKVFVKPFDVDEFHRTMASYRH